MELPNVDDQVLYTKIQESLDPPVTVEATVTAVHPDSGSKFAIDLRTEDREDFLDVAFSEIPAPEHWSPAA